MKTAQKIPTVKEEEEKLARERKELEHLSGFGFVPGNYLNVCTSAGCKTQEFGAGSQPGTFIGAKHSWRCRSCAEKQSAELKANGPEPVRAPQLTRDDVVPRHDHEECRQVDRTVQIPLLLFKMHDEISEISRDLRNPEEYADLFTAMMALAEINGVTPDDIYAAAYEKNRAKGDLLTGKLWVPAAFMEKTSDRAN